MKHICAWCRSHLKTVHDGHHLITHGICPECIQEHFADFAPQNIQEFLDRFDSPILVIDHKAQVKAANRNAQTLLAKTKDEMEDQLTGDVIECGYAKRPGGCGKTYHCKACAIRRTIQWTHTTGTSSKHIPACHDTLGDDDERNIRYLVSTEKVGEMILLRIDDLEYVEPGNPENYNTRNNIPIVESSDNENVTGSQSVINP